MFFGEEDSPFQDLPSEMVVEILSLVALEGKQRTRLVCRRWRWILDHPDARLVRFKQTNQLMTEDSIECLLKSQLLIDHLVLEDVTMTCWPSMTFSRNKFPLIRHLTLGSGNSGQTVMTILQYGCAQAESLTLDYECLSHVRLAVLSRVLAGMRWNQLTELKLKVIVDDISEISQESTDKRFELILKKGRIPMLKVLSLDLLLYREDRLTGMTKLMSNFMTFLEHHSKTVNELNLCFYSDRQEMLIFPNTSAPLFSAEQQESVARDLKLDCVKISTTHSGALLHLVPPCIWESDHLTKLNWDPLWPGPNWLRNPTPKPRLIAPPGTAKPMQALLQRNRNALTHLTTSSILGDNDVDPFEITWLESCSHLTELTVTNCEKMFSVKLQLPTVRKLDIGQITDLKSMENMSIWTSRTFRNLESVQFSVIFTFGVQNREFDWIQTLLVLSRLGEIRFKFTYWYEESRYPFSGPNLVRHYCSDKARLMFSGKKAKRTSRTVSLWAMPYQNTSKLKIITEMNKCLQYTKIVCASLA